MGVSDLVVMQCTGSYPAPIEQANLPAMNEIATCEAAVGFSDHVPDLTLHRRNCACVRL